MGDDMITEGMLDMFIFETEQGLENLENICLDSKDVGEFDDDHVNEIFRIMHTIKGASAVMMYQNIATLSHKLEDVFYYIRESQPENIDVDLSDVLKQDRTLSWAADVLEEKMIDHAQGKLTTAEALNDLEIAVTRIGFTV